MSPLHHQLSLADLAAAGVRLQPFQAAAITRAVIGSVKDGTLSGIPVASALRFSKGGAIGAAGEVTAGCSVERAGRLLESLLPSFDAPAEIRTPGALRIVVARALRTLDLPPFESVDDFAQALERFAPADSAAVASSLYASWQSPTANLGFAHHADAQQRSEESGRFTISDIRRARRSTGLTLTDVATRSHIPVSLLRELEWGYFPNWPGDHYGRGQLVRYARAAGIDEQWVLDTVWPVLQEALRTRTPRVVEGSIIEEPANETAASLVRQVSGVPDAPRAKEESAASRTFKAALAIAALVAVSFVPAMWQSSRRAESPAPAAAQQSDRRIATPAAAPRAAQNTPTRAAGVPTVAAAPTAAPPSVPAESRQRRATNAARLQEDVGFSPTFASTGTAVFYHTAAHNDSALMRADTDSTGAVLRITSVVNDDAQNFHARPSPDGRMIAFDSDREGERAVYVADVDGHNVRRVSGQGFALVPSWSPDGRQLAFVRSEPAHPKVWNLWMVDLATGEITRLTSHSYGQTWGAAWFPDGKRIVYSHEDRLIVRTLEGRSQQIYRSPKRGQLLRTPAVSPDGKRVIFQMLGDGGWMLDVADGSVTKVLDDRTAEEFAWSPDGQRVAYHSRKSGEWNVWILAPR